MDQKISLRTLQRMKNEGRKIVGVVAWDYQIARIVDRAGVDIVSVGDTVGVNLWGHSNPFEVTMEEMLVVAKAVRRGVSRALVSVDFPFGPLQEGADSAVPRRDPLRQGGRRRHGQARRGLGLPRRRRGRHARRHPGVRPVRHHAADRAALRRRVQVDPVGGRRGAGGAEGRARRRGQAAGGRRRRAAELHQLRPGRGGGGGRGRRHPRRRWLRRRTVARRPDAHGERGDRLRGLGDRGRAGHLRQRRAS